MKKLLILAVLVLVVAQAAFGFLPGVPSLRDLNNSGTPAPVEAPLDAVAWEDVSFTIYVRPGSASISTNGDRYSLINANPIGDYAPHSNPLITGEITGGSGPMIRWEITGNVLIQGAHELSNLVVQSYTIPKTRLAATHEDGAGNLILTLPPSFYPKQGDYDISGQVNFIAYNEDGSQNNSGLGFISAIGGTVRVQ